MGLSTKVTIKYGDFGHEVMVPVIVQAMQEDLKSSYSWHLTCPDCATEGNYAKVGLRKFCKNADCENHNEIAKEKYDELRTLDYKTAYDKEKIDACDNEASKVFEVLGSKPKDFPKSRILGCHYLVPNPKEKGSDVAFQVLVQGLLEHSKRSDGKMLIVSDARSKIERLGAIGIDNGNIVMFDVAFDEQIKPLNTTFELDVNEKYTKMGADWIDSLPEFDFATVSSKRNENYERLIDGDEITVATKSEKVEKSVEDMFATGIATTGTTKADKAESVVKDISTKKEKPAKAK